MRRSIQVSVHYCTNAGSVPGVVREKLHDYIRVADDKKLKAIYMMLEDEITEETEWWKDIVFVKELDRRYAAWSSGKEKGYTLLEVDASIEQIKKRRITK